MKTNKLFFGAFALLLTGLASCSDEEPIGAATTPATVSEDGNQYLSVVISSPGMNGSSRAGEEGGTEIPFEAGVGTECLFGPEDIKFLFFDKDGNPFPLVASNVNGTTISNAVQPEVLSSTDESTTHGPGDNPLIKAVLVLGKAVGEGYVGTTPTQAVCFINWGHRLLESQFVNQNLETVLGLSATLPDLSSEATVKFMMTNTTYMDENNVVRNTVDLNGYFQPTKRDAELNPVTFHVERITAKVRLKGLGEYPSKERSATSQALNDNYLVNDELIPLKVELTGWDVRKTAQRNYILKHITEQTINGGFAGWNDFGRHRCYWSEPLNGGVVDTDYDIFNAKSPNYVNNKNYDSNNPTRNNEYCLENTLQPQSITDRMSNATGIVVRGVVKADFDKDGNFEPVSLVRWAGAYYTEAKFREIVANAYNGRVGSGATQATADNVVFTSTSSATSPNTWNVSVFVSNKDNPMPNFSGILRWENGVTSYYFNIEHSIGSTPDKKLFGVIRNHIYECEVSGVVGLGIPGNEPGQKDETESFLAARIYCLNWRVINNTVTLE